MTRQKQKRTNNHEDDDNVLHGIAPLLPCSSRYSKSGHTVVFRQCHGRRRYKTWMMPTYLFWQTHGGISWNVNNFAMCSRPEGRII